MRLIHRLSTATFPAAPLAWTRMLVAAAALLKCWILAPALLALATPDALRVPIVPGFSPTPTIATVVIFLWVTAALALAVGWLSQPAAALLTGVIATTFLLDQQLYSNHLYLLGIMTFLLAVARSGAAASVDARLHGPTAFVPAYPVLMLMAMPPIVYLFAGLSKINGYWLSGGVLHGSLRDGALSLPAALRTPDLMMLLAAVTVVAEVFIALGLLIRRVRPMAIIAGVGAHVGMITMLKGPLELIAFALMALSVYHLYAYAASPAAVPRPARQDHVDNTLAQPLT